MPALIPLFNFASCVSGVSSCDDHPIYRMMLPLCPVVAALLLVLIFLSRREK